MFSSTQPFLRLRRDMRRLGQNQATPRQLMLYCESIIERNSIKMTQSMMGRKIAVSILVGMLVFALILTGTFALPSFFQQTMSPSETGGRIHNHFDEQSGIKNIFAENFGEEPVIVRIRFYEFLEPESGFVLPFGADRDNHLTWRVHRPNVINEPGNNALFGHLRNWDMGGETWFMPTFNRDPYSLATDVSGDAIDFESNTSQGTTSLPNGGDFTAWEAGASYVGALTYRLPNGALVQNPGYVMEADFAGGHNNQARGANGVMTFAYWIANYAGTPHATGPFWVIAPTGWTYWMEPLQPSDTTSLLLGQIGFNPSPDHGFHYVSHVRGQFAAPDCAAEVFGESDRNDRIPNSPILNEILDNCVIVEYTGAITSWNELRTAINNAPRDGTRLSIEITQNLVSNAYEPSNLITIPVGASIILTGDATLYRASHGRHFRVDGELTLNSPDLTLTRTAEMIAADAVGGGIQVGGPPHYAHGVFTLNAGVIAGNRANISGGGVHVSAGATFRMNGGEITENRAAGYGGGLRVNSTQGYMFIIGGRIHNNVVLSDFLPVREISLAGWNPESYIADGIVEGIWGFNAGDRHGDLDFAINIPHHGVIYHSISSWIDAVEFWGTPSPIWVDHADGSFSITVFVRSSGGRVILPCGTNVTVPAGASVTWHSATRTHVINT